MTTTISFTRHRDTTIPASTTAITPLTEQQRYWRKRWAEALRSGAYTQTTGPWKMEREGQTSHCAGGVLFDLMVQDGLVPAWEPIHVTGTLTDGSGYTAFNPGGHESCSRLACALVGVESFYAIVYGNDWGGQSFVQLADAIEQSLETGVAPAFPNTSAPSFMTTPPEPGRVRTAVRDAYRAPEFPVIDEASFTPMPDLTLGSALRPAFCRMVEELVPV